jgi:hypothetical protein
MSKTFPKKIDKNFDVSFSSTFLVLSRFRVFLSDESSETLQKTFCNKRFAKNIVSKSFYKKIDQKSKTDFFSILFYHVFGRFSVRGVQKHDQQNIPFSYSDPPTHHVGRAGTGVTYFCFAGPLSMTSTWSLRIRTPLSRVRPHRPATKKKSTKKSRPAWAS